MSFLPKILLPVAASALVLIGVLLFVWGPGNLTGAQQAELLTLLLAAVALILFVTWAVIEFFVRRPLKSIINSNAQLVGDPAGQSSEFEQLKRTVAAAQASLLQTQRELAATTRSLETVRAGLHASEERYALAVRGASDGMWEWDIASGALELSPRWKAMLGFADPELANTLEAWKARIHRADRAGVETALQAHLDGASSRFESEHRLLHRDTTHRWILSRGTALRHASGRPYRVIGLDTDITAFKQMEETLLHVAEGTSTVTGEAFFRSLVRNLAEALQVPVALLTECVDYPPTRVRALACWAHGDFQTGIEYALAGTPCEHVIQDNVVRHCAQGLTGLFQHDFAVRGLESYVGIPISDASGKVLGHLAFMSEKEMTESTTFSSIYRIFAARAAAELRRRQVQKVVSDMAAGLAALRGEECLQALVEKFCAVIGTREAIVTECIEQPVKRLRVLAWWRDGRLQSNVEYDLAGTTCEETINQGSICVYPSGVGERFPPAKPFGRESYLGVPCFSSGGKVIGHIACFDDKPMSAELLDRAILELFAERAALELERKRLWRTLYDLSERITPLRGPEFFKELVCRLAQVLNVREAFITECMNYPTTRMHRLAHWKNKQFIECKDYDLPGAPCEDVVNGGDALYCPTGVSERWPREKPLGWESYIGIACRDTDGRVIGHVAIVDDKPMRKEQPEWSVLNLLAERAAIELERRQLGAPIAANNVAHGDGAVR